ncbi:MAG: 50S ribosomal protein L10 [Candidatus Altiarchaeales archaeon]|nr:50S ribosomal protein L10 [Candidatus Altiarchaeota archaeon]MBU4341950.1 50S ribosomal protein L10 [Candidatus Altiarchaeota archaeon]MBU4406384.1 50S ribosomal protein L10 [Candidatus Altiarchaeota archaeon]MBU4436764.1 50S ribosomal protein L10 [Candidatus Altiarchaeota archaeon]MCG2783262.1 50S ribosomal protein L10 [Candidatus Altiarchaeales archaeon]
MVAPWKPKEVEELAKKMSKSKVVGIVNIEGIPSKQLQQMRKSLKSKAEIRVSKKNLITRAFEKAKLTGMIEHLNGSLGLVFSDSDPFKLNKIIVSGKISAPPKAGSVSPHDIIVPAGDTSLPPGPVIGDLQQAKIKAKIAGGKIVITEDSLVVKEGDVISPEVASALARLGIEPIEIGLELKAAYEDGTIYTSDVLYIDDAETLERIRTAYINSLNLAMDAGIYNKVTIPLLLSDAYRKAINLATNAEILIKETIKTILAKANAQAAALKSIIPEPAPQPEGKAEEKPAEEQAEKPAEEKVEEKPKAEEKPAEEAKPGPEKKEEKPAEEKPAEEEPKAEEPKPEEPKEEAKTEAEKPAEESKKE